MDNDKLKKVYHGFDTGLLVELNGERFIVPSTGEIGRSVYGKGYSLSLLTRPHYIVKTDDISDLSISDEIQKKNGGITILNIGCGGCADIPYLQRTLETSFMRNVSRPLYSTMVPKVKIVNADLSDNVVGAVKSGEHPYYIYHDLNLDKIKVSSLGSRFDSNFDYYAAKSLKEILYEFFIFKGKEMSESRHNGWIGMDDNHVRCRYEMKSRYRENLTIEKADVKNLPYDSKSFDVVLAQGLFLYLSEEDKSKARREIIRVLKPRGFCFPEFGTYQKIKDSLVRVNGRMWPPSKGLGDRSKNGIERNLKGILPITYSLEESFPFPFSSECLIREKDLGQWNYFFKNSDSTFEGIVLEKAYDRRKKPAPDIRLP